MTQKVIWEGVIRESSLISSGPILVLSLCTFGRQARQARNPDWAPGQACWTDPLRRARPQDSSGLSRARCRGLSLSRDLIFDGGYAHLITNFEGLLVRELACRIRLEASETASPLAKMRYQVSGLGLTAHHVSPKGHRNAYS